MIEISHTQARFLIRRAADRKLPGEQWSALEAHLENCAACRAYQADFASMEKSLRRGLRQRWRENAGPAEGLPAAVTSRLSWRARLRGRVFRVGMGLLALAALLAVGLWTGRLPGLLHGSDPKAPGAAATPTAALPTPSPAPAERYRGVVVFEASENGHSDIFLLNAQGTGQPELTNLTHDAAADSDPTWSPDGEWIAFLSDRAPDLPPRDQAPTGKPELYVMSVAGTRLVRLTDAPEITWQGPLSWSYDGRWIALAGRRKDQNNTPWIYMVPVGGGRQDGGAPRALPRTRGTTGWARFSPTRPVLAVQRADGSILAYDITDGWSTLATTGILGKNVDREGGFDWAMGGSSLLFLSFDPQAMARGDRTASQLRITSAIGLNSRDFEGASELLATTTASPFRSVAYQPGGVSIAALQDDRGAGCWTVHLYNPFLSNEMKVLNLPDLCVESRLERESWSPRDLPGATLRWIVVAARPGGGQPGSAGIYAVNVPVPLAPWLPQAIERLADIQATAGTVPRVRPASVSLDIQPRGANSPASAGAAQPPALPVPSAAAAPPSDLPGQIWMAEHTAGALGSSIVRIHPDGSQRGEQVVADAINDCPAPSPDGARLAFRSNRSAAPPRPAVPTTSQTLWLLDPARKKTLTQLIIQGMSMVGEQTLAQQQLSCPSWSPDGKHLAAAVSIDQVNSLVVVSPGGTLERYIHLDFPTSPHAPLVWFSNNRTLLFAQPDNAGSGARIFQAWWNESFPSTLLLSLDGWDDVQGMSISPDGKQLALVLVHHKTAVRPADASLRVVNLADLSVAYQKEIYGYDPSALRGVGRIFWMQDKQVVFASPDGPLEHYKAMILRYDPGSDTLQTLAFVEDTLYDWALNGPWLVYSSESGLWGLPVIGRYDLPAAARRIAPDAPDEIAWK